MCLTPPSGKRISRYCHEVGAHPERFDAQRAGVEANGSICRRMSPCWHRMRQSSSLLTSLSTATGRGAGKSYFADVVQYQPKAKKFHISYMNGFVHSLNATQPVLGTGCSCPCPLPHPLNPVHSYAFAHEI